MKTEFSLTSNSSYKFVRLNSFLYNILHGCFGFESEVYIMSKHIPDNKHLTLDERKIIQIGIENRSNKVDIARTIGKDPTTVAFPKFTIVGTSSFVISLVHIFV